MAYPREIYSNRILALKNGIFLLQFFMKFIIVHTKNVNKT